MRLRQGVFNASGTPNAHLTDEILRIFLVKGQENCDFIRSNILNMIQEIGDGEIAKVEPKSENSSGFFGFSQGPIEYFSKEYFRKTGNFEYKRWLFNPENPTGILVSNNFRKLDVIQAEAYRGEIKLATAIERGTDTTISMTGYELNIWSMEDVLKEHPASINGVEPGLTLRTRLSASLALSGIEKLSDYKVVTRASTICIRQMKQQLIREFEDNVQRDHRLYGQSQKIKSQIELMFDK
jgi:hypothetical protein